MWAFKFSSKTPKNTGQFHLPIAKESGNTVTRCDLVIADSKYILDWRPSNNTPEVEEFGTKSFCSAFCQTEF